MDVVTRKRMSRGRGEGPGTSQGPSAIFGHLALRKGPYTSTQVFRIRSLNFRFGAMQLQTLILLKLVIFRFEPKEVKAGMI